MVEIVIYLAVAAIHAISGKRISVALKRAELQGAQPRRLYWVPLYPECLYLSHRGNVGRPWLDLLTGISILSFLVGVLVLVRIAVVYAT